jgi:hypothetical protein
MPTNYYILSTNTRPTPTIYTNRQKMLKMHALTNEDYDALTKGVLDKGVLDKGVLDKDGTKFYLTITHSLTEANNIAKQENLFPAYEKVYMQRLWASYNVETRNIGTSVKDRSTIVKATIVEFSNLTNDIEVFIRTLVVGRQMLMKPNSNYFNVVFRYHVIMGGIPITDYIYVTHLIKNLYSLHELIKLLREDVSLNDGLFHMYSEFGYSDSMIDVLDVTFMEFRYESPELQKSIMKGKSNYIKKLISVNPFLKMEMISPECKDGQCFLKLLELNRFTLDREDYDTYVKGVPIEKNIIESFEDRFDCAINIIKEFKYIHKEVNGKYMRLHEPVFSYKSEKNSIEIKTVNIYYEDQHAMEIIGDYYLIDENTFAKEITKVEYEASISDNINDITIQNFTCPQAYNRTLICFFDFETVSSYKLRKHIPISVSYCFFELSIFLSNYLSFSAEDFKLYLLHPEYERYIEGFNCTKKFIKDSHKRYGTDRVFYYGYNSSKFDNYLVLDTLLDMDIHPNVSFIKDKLFFEEGFHIWKDFMPLLAGGTLAKNCKAYKTQITKAEGLIDFNQLNEIYNSDPDEFFINIKKIISIAPNADKSLTISQVLERYNMFDCYSLANLFAIYSGLLDEQIEKLFNRPLSCKNVELNKIQKTPAFSITAYKTLGEISMAILLTCQAYLSDHNKEAVGICQFNINKSMQKHGRLMMQKKDKRKQHLFSVILNENTLPESESYGIENIEQLYKVLKSSLIASISYGIKNFKSLPGVLYALIDVVSLYPYVMACKTLKYGYGKLIHTKEFNGVYETFDSHELALGIYKAEFYYDDLKDNKIRVIPFKPKANSPIGTSVAYQWAHDRRIVRMCYAQDIIAASLYDKVKIKIHNGFYFEKTATGYEIFGSYILPFMDEKNRQDSLKEMNDSSYSAGIREICKAYLNIMSGKMVQEYNYSSSLAFELNDKLEKNMNTEQVKIDKLNSPNPCKITNYDFYDFLPIKKIRKQSFNIEKKYHIYKKHNLEKKDIIYDNSLLGAQLYCYARSHLNQCIKVVYACGDEPVMIETDCILCKKETLQKIKDRAPTIKNIYGNLISRITVPSEKDSDGKIVKQNLKQFGQFDPDPDYKDINNVKVYMKKSYIFDALDPSNKPISKKRFKGISDRAVLIDDEKVVTELENYNKAKSFITGFIKENTIDSNTEEKYFEQAILELITKYEDLLLKKALVVEKVVVEWLGKKNKLAISHELFDMLREGKPVNILQASIKRNIITENRKTSLTLENVFCIKSFNLDKESKKEKSLPMNLNSFLEWVA